ncbi:unnamed protein product [Urochloa decumbens]|uniref:F-box domain-containing protein n=1 Tax=Urochloa decumbens TaxID=240449 RepID=A0ABC9E4V5_9POAL
MAMVPRMRAVSAVAHETEADMRRRRCYRYRYRYEDALAGDGVIVYSYDLPGPGIPGGLLRLGYGVGRLGDAMRRIRDARQGLREDESIPLGDKIGIAVDVFVGTTHVVVGACDFVVGACDFTQYARGALARFRGKSSSRGKRSDPCLRKRICEKRKYDVQFEDLPEEAQCIIFSKLELKEAVRSSVLSSKWTNMWIIGSKLRFDCTKLCGKFSSENYRTRALNFVEKVNRVLRLQHGKVVETLEIKVEFYMILAFHLDRWVRFAATSRTKNLSLDLVPKSYGTYSDWYVFPSEVLDGEFTSRLQQIQLSFVSFKLPSQFSGFPKLKRLDLNLLRVTRMDLQDMLSGCSKLEWLSIVNCDLEDELIVDRPLSHLQYLRIACCKMTKIELHATKLKTFIYHAAQLPDFPTITIQAQELKDADIAVTDSTTFEHALTALPKMFARVQNLSLRAYLREKPAAFLENSSKFSQLKHLVLYHSDKESDNILYLASFLRAAPLLEELEIHFNIKGGSSADTWHLRNLPKCPYKHLRSICITGFKGDHAQAELLVHAVENAPALEVVTIDPANKLSIYSSQVDERLGASIARRCLEGKILPKTKLHIVEINRDEWVVIPPALNF